jgi:hypothetical protein
MRRVAAFAFFGAAVAFANWRLVPVWSEQSTVRPPIVMAPTSSEVSALNVELARLEARTTTHSSLAPVERDPFGFAAPPPRANAKPVTPVALPPPPPPAPQLPKLIAISTKNTSAGVIRTAALSLGDAVLLAHPGDKVGTLVVHTIDDGTVELVDPVTGTAYRVR